MRKSSKTILGIFCAGVLAMGIGAGIAFAEFTSLEYGGTIQVGEEGATDHVITIDVSQAKHDIVFLDAMAFGGDPVMYDPTLPAGTIKIVANYNDAYTAFWLWDAWGRLVGAEEGFFFLDPVEEDEWYGYYDDGSIESDLNYIYVGWGLRDEFQFVWTIKDQVLSDLKSGVIAEYPEPGIFHMQVYASPDLKGRIAE